MSPDFNDYSNTPLTGHTPANSDALGDKIRGGIQSRAIVDEVYIHADVELHATRDSQMTEIRPNKQSIARITARP